MNNNEKYFKGTVIPGCFNLVGDISGCFDCELTKREIECILEKMPDDYGIIKPNK